jgi:hypothetical protein
MAFLLCAFLKRTDPADAKAMKHFHLPVERSTLCQKNAIFGHLEV